MPGKSVRSGKKRVRARTSAPPRRPPRNPRVANLCVVAPAEGPLRHARLHVWHEVPGLSTAISSSAGDNLEISVCAEMWQQGGSVWFRALVDGEPVEPSDVVFKTGATMFDGVRSFTFVQSNVSAGQHIVEIQWRSGTKVSIRDRVLTVCAGSPGAGPIRLATSAAPSGVLIEKSSSSYSDIPGMSATVVTSAEGTLAAVFSAEAFASSGQMLVRALVDNSLMSEITFVQAGDPARGGTRSYTFTRSILPAGTHEVKLQWKAVGGKCQLGDRTLSVTAAPVAHQRSASRKPRSPITLKSTGWTNLGVTSFVANDPVSVLAVTLSAEVTSNKGRIFVRALVDGEPALPNDVTLIEGGPKWRASSYTFLVKNLEAGVHSVRLEGLSDPNTKAQVRAHSFRVLGARRSGSDFAQPFMNAAPRVRGYRLLVIGCDPLRPAHPAPTFEQVKAVFEGDSFTVVEGEKVELPPGFSRGPNLRDWLAENSGGLVRLSEIRYYGCGNPQWYVPPPAHQGNYYWDNGAFAEMFQDAVLAADPDVDFHSYDLDGNNRLDLDDTLVALIRPQNSPYGTLRGTTAILDNVPPPLSMPALDIYVSSMASQRTSAVGICAHELCHLIFAAPDLYGNCPNIDAGYYNIMDMPWRATHLDPFDKMKNGLVRPQAIELTTASTATYAVPAVEIHRSILLLHDVDHVANEYFIVENRFGGSPVSPNYDQSLNPGAIVIWQLFENPTLVQSSAVCPGDPRSVRMSAVLRTAGQSYELAWADGSPAGVRLTAVSVGGEHAQLRLEKL